MFPQIGVLPVGWSHRSWDGALLWHRRGHRHGEGVSDRHRGLRSSAATVSSCCEALAAHHKCGSVFLAQFYPFQADTNFSHGCPNVECFSPLPFLSPPLLGIIFILPRSFAAVFWSEWGFCARPLLCHQLAAAFQGDSLMVWCLCHPLYTCVRITVLGSGQQGE